MRAKHENERKKVQRVEKDISYQNEQISEYEKIFKEEMDGKISPLNEEKGKLEKGKA